MKTNEEKIMKFEIYSSNYINNPQNCLYPNKFIVKDEVSAKEAFSHDYVCAKYKDNYRSIDTFQSTSTIATIIPENGNYPEQNDEFSEARFSSYKIGSLTKIKTWFIYDRNFDVKAYACTLWYAILC